MCVCPLPLHITDNDSQRWLACDLTQLILFQTLSGKLFKQHFPLQIKTINCRDINWNYWCKSKMGWHFCISITIAHTLFSHLIDQTIINKQEFLWISNLLFPLQSVQMMAKTWMEWKCDGRKSGNKSIFHLLSILHCNPQVLKRVGRQLAPSRVKFNFFHKISPRPHLAPPPTEIWMGFFGLHWYSECTFLRHIFIHMKTWHKVLYSESGFSAWPVTAQRMLLKYNSRE